MANVAANKFRTTLILPRTLKEDLEALAAEHETSTAHLVRVVLKAFVNEQKARQLEAA
jgi:predicted DNA-binding protein